MKKTMACVAGFILFYGVAQAGDRLDAEAIKKLITGNTVNVVRGDGSSIKNYFSADGKVIRYENGATSEGTWQVKDDGMHCVEGMIGDCGRIEKNSDGTHDRVPPFGRPVTWTSVTSGKDF